MLEAFFAPRSIAVVGASQDEAKVGHAVFANLLSGGYTGPVYPVNPSSPAVLGHTAYPTLGDLPERVDCAVIVVPAARTIAVVEECVTLGIPAAIVISAGFREAGPDGAALERVLVTTARAGGVRLLGPNCLGLIATRSGLNASFAPIMPERGSISFLSQSGALGTAILDWAAGEGIGLAHFVSLGNKADISEVDLIRAWTDDPDTGVVVAYLEGIADGVAFVEAVSRLVSRAPFIALTAGSSDAGARAVSSHTGSLAGSRVAYAAAFRKAGAVAVTTVEELFDLAEGFSRQPLPAGPGTVILTNAGGPAILATDACDRNGVALASLDAATVAALREVLPDAAAVYNPVDILGDAGPDRYEAAARILVADPGVRSLLVVLTPQAMTDARATAERIAAIARESGVTTLAAFMGDRSVAAGMQALKDGGIPGYSFPERAVGTLAAMERHRERLDRAPSEPLAIAADTSVVTEAIAHARAADRTFVTEASAHRIAAAYGIPVPKAGLAPDHAAARQLAAEIGYPVVVKIASPDILHKSDIGGIALDITSVSELDAAYERMMSRVQQRMPDATIWGVTLQEQLPVGREVIIGIDRDPSFGPILMFGLGGVYVEVLKDVTFRLCPVTPADAHEMIAEIRGFGILRGARGQAPADIEAIVDVICRVSALAVDTLEITELDINPLIVGDRGTGAVAADVRIGIGE
ncbi:MAG: acetate--CoA ligase family protein [Coriobacteriia bacterium]|nr:acetate--CoA ligase family protein [Actinomycetota bacterium]MDZ4167561.1 acetate--CoA ligase family protein [Coriobacteriia bacterium]